MERPSRRRHPAFREALLFAAGLAGAAPAGAAPAVPPAASCATVPGDARVIPVDVAAEGDVTLEDGRVLRMAGLDLARGTAAAPDRPARLRAALLAWANGGVTLHELGPADRWGRVPALLFRGGPPEDADPGTSGVPGEAGAALLAAGLARVAPEPSVHACAAGRLAVEAAAREARRGLWADPAMAVLTPGDADGLAAQAGGLAIVRGILRVHESRGALYLTLGRDRRGFTAVVSRRDAKLFARAGVDLRDYAGTPVRLRGDLDARFGPRLRLTDPDAVESLEPGSLGEDGRDER